MCTHFTYYKSIINIVLSHLLDNTLMVVISKWEFYVTQIISRFASNRYGNNPFEEKSNIYKGCFVI